MTDEMMRRRTKLMPLWRNTPFAAPVYRPPQNPRVVLTLLDGELAVVAAFMRISSKLRMNVVAFRRFLRRAARTHRSAKIRIVILLPMWLADVPRRKDTSGGAPQGLVLCDLVQDPDGFGRRSCSLDGV